MANCMMFRHCYVWVQLPWEWRRRSGKLELGFGAQACHEWSKKSWLVYDALEDAARKWQCGYFYSPSWLSVCECCDRDVCRPVGSEQQTFWGPRIIYKSIFLDDRIASSIQAIQTISNSPYSQQIVIYAICMHIQYWTICTIPEKDRGSKEKDLCFEI